MKTIDVQQSYLMTIANLVDYCCNTSHYINLSEQEALNLVEENLFFWSLVEEQFSDNCLDYQKRELLYVIEIRFGIQFSNSDKKMLMENSLCTFHDVAAIVDAIKSRQLGK
ncbi:hypothetical protein [Chroococcus sp. FPU101]|uniref:hypothetical protein n=1 Tax=Chroococcus sp. FPU101 TaxID=1974212 RepID=UPI001A8FB085|nr:hypothetical protein [Chroococcus sp. FPU101]GFE70414.1 hypothetical protein CFPU101_30240 [Chroococcus sp. FPU101]